MNRKFILASVAVTASTFAGSLFAMDSMMGNNTMMMNNGMMMNSTMMMKTLKMGSTGSEVVKLQNALIEAGYLQIPRGVKKGTFGIVTRNALKKFQKAKGIPVTGMFDMKTMGTLDAAMNMKNGVMVGGALMVSKLDIVDNAVNANNVTTVVAAVKAAGLVETLKSAGPFTVFAPNNSAFEKLPAGTVETLLKPENKDKLVDILTYHVVAGKYTTADLYNGLTLTTVEGKKLKFTMMNGKLAINGTTMIETPNVISKNGVTHVIDGVLMP